MSLVLVQTDGAQLEAEVHVNSTARFPNVGILLVHPYSGLGGSMNDYVVAELYRYSPLIEQKSSFRLMTSFSK